MIGAYLKFDDLAEEQRIKLGIKLNTERIDCTASTSLMGNLSALEPFRNKNSQLVLYRDRQCRACKNPNQRRTPDYCLGNGKHFTGLFFDNLNYPTMAWGDFGNDGILAIVQPDFKTFELLIVPNGKNLMRGYYQQFIDGEFEEEIEKFRQLAKPHYFDYGL